MNNTYTSQVLWSQMDANQHLRHSAYADIAAQARLMVLEEIGLGMQTMHQLKIGPILFREELLYKREVLGTQTLTMKSYVSKLSHGSSRWSIRTEIFRQDGVLAAEVNVDGAWMDLKLRKLGNLPEDYALAFEKMPKTDDFVNNN